jgi:hypothetical protein
MKNKLLIIWLLLVILLPPVLIADEGMWIPLLIEKYNIKLMQEKGFKLNAEDIYSINKACMKDAIVIFGSGCTGELISPDGLLITNYHCGYDQIQEHSTLEHDYLTDGFWAMSKEEELSNPQLTVTFLKSMEDVTDKVLTGVTEGMQQAEMNKIINANILAIRNKAVEGTGFTASVRPFFMGNQYFLFVNELYRDVRLVGAPPSAIGKFGGDTDNWIWPRHTGDFSLFRVYAGKDNTPADYSKDNVPYKPAYYFPISLKGVHEGDFTMVFGYPGTTYEYVPSFYIDMVKNLVNPRMIDIRTKKIEIMDAAMNADPLIRIQYSSKKVDLSNSWKKWIGENQGLERMKTIEKKQEFEMKFQKWTDSDVVRRARYGNILLSYNELYNDIREYNLVNSFTNEVFFNTGADLMSFARSFAILVNMVENEADPAKIEQTVLSLKAEGADFFKDFNQLTDKKLFIEIMTLYGENLDPKWQTPEYIRLKNKYKGDFSSLADILYGKSIFSDEARFNRVLDDFSKSSLKKITSDAFYILASDASNFLATTIKPEIDRINPEIQKLNKLYMTAQMEFEKDKIFYPDANSTLRVTYGEVKGYDSKDAVYFNPYSTLKGIIEKDNPAVYDYNVPQKLRDIYKTHDFGPYTQDGEVPVCFIATNHTTGGNSGSPVINADGHLIGINFDRAWEGVASDMMFNPEQSRNISLDIRYVLFIIDKFAGAGYLLKEMTLIE